jgi:outer membrane protein, heavy metal efflux system
MRHVRKLGCLLLATTLSLVVRPAHAQISQLADDLVILSNRLRAKEDAKTHQHLGPGPGSMESLFPIVPGARRPIPGEPSSSMTPGQAAIAPPLTQAPAPTPLYGALEVPSTMEEGPANGLTLDQAIERLVQENPDLRTRFQELPKAQADILSAGLRNNPFVFGNVGNVPYGSYSPQRPGGVNYEVTVIQSWDVNQKRLSRIRVAQNARNVLECLYQDAVRLEIDNLYTAFLDVLAAREALRQQQTGLAGLEKFVEETRKLVLQGETRAQTDLDRAEVQRDMASIAVQDASAALARARQTLAVLLNLPPDAVDCLQLRGAISSGALTLPTLDELLHVALTVRPDLNAYRLGIQRAQAEVQLARADRWADVFVLYTPWQLQNNAAIGGQNATSWSLGALVTLPVFNRNQGNISRARSTVAQTIIELQGREQQVTAEVRRAYLEYTTTHDAVERYQSNILPRARRIRDDKLRLFKAGSESILAFLGAQKEYNDVVRQYLETTIRNRRSALRLNTAIGQRIIP